MTTKATRIAVMNHHTFPAHVDITANLYEEGSDLSFILFHCKERNERVRSAQVEEIEHYGYKAIVTLGSHATMTTLRACKKQKVNIPIIHVAVDNPAELGLDKEKYPITGISVESAPLEIGLELYLMAKPTMKKLLIPFEKNGDEGRLIKKVRAAKKYLSGLGVEVITQGFSALEEGSAAIEKHIANSGIDSVMYLESCLTEGMMRSLGHLCCEQNVDLFAPTTQGVKLGATASFADSFVGFAPHIIQTTRKILAGEKPDSLEFANDRKLIVNSERATRPGSKILPALLACLSGVSIYE